VKVYAVTQYVYTPSDGDGGCLKIFADYDGALHYVKNYRNWCEEFCDPANDVWGDEYSEIRIEEMTVE